MSERSRGPSQTGDLPGLSAPFFPHLLFLFPVTEREILGEQGPAVSSSCVAACAGQRSGGPQRLGVDLLAPGPGEREARFLCSFGYLGLREFVTAHRVG